LNTEPSRKARRAGVASAAKAYGIKGKSAAAMHEAYQALAAGKSSWAVQLAHGVSQGHPDSVHPWMVLGAVALERREASTAITFFDKALTLCPKEPAALSGKGKAYFLQADAFQAVTFFQAAIAAGSKDADMARLYGDLMCRLGRFTIAAQHLQLIAARLKEAALWLLCAEIYVGAGLYPDAGKAFEQAYRLAPKLQSYRVGWAKALIFRHDYVQADQWLDQIMGEDPLDDELATLKMITLRNLGKWDLALGFVDYPYRKPAHYQRALAQAGYVAMDQNDMSAAERYLQEAVFVDNLEQVTIAKSLATVLFLNGNFEKGTAYYGARLSFGGWGNNKPTIALDPNLRVILSEQGVGDQLALLPLIGLLQRKATAPAVQFVAEARMEPVVARTDLPLVHSTLDQFEKDGKVLETGLKCHLGDLVQLLGSAPPDGRKLGGYLQPERQKIYHVAHRYAKLAKGRPIVGLAWRSRESLTGFHRSIPLVELVKTLPAEAFVVSLQYGDVSEDIRQAKKLRPDIVIFEDPEVNQIVDLMAFMVQVAALDCVLTIDNTTAHICGALGHCNAHVLLPAGAECMWYWGLKGEIDPWYSCLHLHRQRVAQSWDRPLDEIRTLMSSSR